MMVHCVICNKDFASSNSLRSHRSRYHKQSDTNVKDSIESQENTQSSQLRHDVKSQDSIEQDSQSSKHVEDTDEEDTADEMKDILSSKRKRLETDDEKNVSKKKDQHFHKELSGIHDLLKNHLEDKVYGSLFCYCLKQEIDRFVPEWFDNESKLQEALTEEQYLYVNMIRNLNNFSDVHMVFNDKKDHKTLVGIFEIIKNGRN